MVTLVNAGKKSRTVMLNHDTTKQPFKQTSRDKSSGALVQRRVEVSTPVSVTLHPGETLTGLPDSAAQLPDVLVGLKYGLQILVSEDTPPAAEAPQPKIKSSRGKGK